ncbi:MAG: hypothetical protein RLZZ200_167 [Pseudomonadota bacterium]|jgi:murein L,D-transpeptidase YafK
MQRNLKSLLLATAALMSLGAPADEPGLVPTAYSTREAGTAGSASDPLPLVDRVVVRKGQRRLELLRGGEVIRSYKVALGLQPAGHKEREGDFRTPEGRYQLTRRNPRSDYFLSIQVSYPNDEDVRRARENGWAPGGSIMIHGLPNTLKKDRSWYATHDWTNGCIALSNADMVEMWLLARNNLPIDILP